MDCFISYSAFDVELARALKQRLVQNGLAVFLAEDSIPAGTEWRPLISTAVRRCELTLLLDSPDSRKSPWVQQEAGMAQASGSLVVPISIDGQLDKLPGWLADFEAVKLNTSIPLEAALDQLVTQLLQGLESSASRIPAQLKAPRTIADAVLRSVLIDQFLGPPERAGAWSRQYDRYLYLYYGDAPIHHAVSQSASLTFTGMIIERAAAFRSSATKHIIAALNGAIAHAEVFVLASQDRLQGGFGRLSSDHRSRGGRALQLDLRHTCWAIRALLAIDHNRFEQQINDGLRWLGHRATTRGEEDRWCWSAAPLLALLMDPRLSGNTAWCQVGDQIRGSVERDLEEGFDPALRSWVKGEKPEMRRSACIDNALYVLYCLKDVQGLSTRLLDECTAAIDGIIAQSSGSTEQGGIPLFAREPEVGPTAQLLEILHDDRRSECQYFTNFIAKELAAQHLMPQTFSWHLIAALTLPDLRDRTL